MFQCSIKLKFLTAKYFVVKMRGSDRIKKNCLTQHSCTQKNIKKELIFQISKVDKRKCENYLYLYPSYDRSLSYTFWPMIWLIFQIYLLSLTKKGFFCGKLWLQLTSYELRIESEGWGCCMKGEEWRIKDLVCVCVFVCVCVWGGK